MKVLELVESIALERCIAKEVVMKIVEDTIRDLAIARYGNEDIINVKLLADGSFEVFLEQMVVEEKYDDDFSKILLEKAQIRNPNIQLGDVIKEVLPLTIGKSDIENMLYALKNNLNKIQKEKEYEAFIDKAGTCITGYIKRAEINEAIISFAEGEGILKKSDMLPNETLKSGSYIKVYVKEVRQSPGRQIFLSRTHEGFLAQLLKNEVPEIKDGLVEIKAVARDAGSIAKVAVFTTRNSIDPVKVCIGEYGSRVQAVTKELMGEKINILLWSENLHQFIANALAPAHVLKIVEKPNKRFDAILEQEQFSKAMGRGGQNVILAKRLCKVNSIKLMTQEEEAKIYQETIIAQVAKLTSSLGIEEMMAHLLISEGLNTIEKIATISLEKITSMKGFDEETAKILQERAKEFFNHEIQQIKEKLAANNKADSILEVAGFNLEHIKILIENGIFEKGEIALLEPKALETLFINDDELYLSFEQANDIISNARGIPRRN